MRLDHPALEPVLLGSPRPHHFCVGFEGGVLRLSGFTLLHPEASRMLLAPGVTLHQCRRELVEHKSESDGLVIVINPGL